MGRPARGHRTRRGDEPIAPGSLPAGGWGFGIVAGAVCVIGAATPAHADEFVDRVNAVYTDIKPERRSDRLILPLVAKMTPPPVAVADVDRAMMLPSGVAGWSDAAAWAEKPEQRAVLDQVRAIGKQWDQPPAWGFAQPYGAEGVSIDLIRAKLYTDLGDPPTLAAAQFLYLDAVQNVEILVHVEATRLAAEGKADEAIRLLVDWGFLARQIADRQFYREFTWGLAALTRSATRIRDVVYTDWRDKKVLAESGKLPVLTEVVERLDPEKGDVKTARLRFPVGERAAAEQIIARVYVARGKVDAAAFASTMSALGSTERPLRLFGEASAWQGLAAGQRDWHDVTAELPKLYNDWTSRWDLDPFDRRMDIPFYYASMDQRSMAAISKVIPDMSWLFGARQAFAAEVVGTRGALGVVGFWYANRSLPPTLASIRPRFVNRLDADPFNPDRARGQRPPLEYFVPIRDQPQADRTAAQPHEVHVFIPGGANFVRRFRDDQFILYSVGKDGAKNWAARVQNTWELAPGADYLIWPPVISLYRQHLIDSGALK